jgi:hypothetical protein
VLWPSCFAGRLCWTSPGTWPSLGNLLAVMLHSQTPERFTRDVLPAQQSAATVNNE